ncbi:MAG TPA: hypothetical protein P5186_18070 [Candidatus Paceibacterota bacterium]|nr:hypothetical protein [Verrucomicrobiota bacterium]HRY49961.1 hypothetical protein [Candidatus Paceibacterota bacterium]
MQKDFFLWTLCLIMAVNWTGFGGNCNQPGLDEERAFTDIGVDYTIHYTTNAGTTHRISHANALDMENMAITSYDRLVNVMNFRTPYLNTLPDFAFVVKDDWYYAEPGCVVMHAPGVRADPEASTRCIFLHERFHTVQRHYKCDVADCDSGYIGSTFGKWVAEGTADAVMDKGYLDIDDSTGSPFYEASARIYLQNPAMTIFDHEYNASIWWNYLMEQLGTERVEPHYGIDFMRAFWNQVAANGDSGSAACLTALRQTIAARTPRSLESLFVDFAVCNYAREFDVTGLHEARRYQYVDEKNQPILDEVPRTAVAAVPFTRNDEPINSYAARYFEYVTAGLGNCNVIGFKADDAGDVMGFAVAAVDQAGKVISIRTGIGKDFAGSFFNSSSRPIRRLCGIAVGLSDATQFDCAMDEGGAKVSIIRPTFSHPAYPGSHTNAGNVVVRMMVSGPGALTPDDPGSQSVMGLRREDFTATIGGIEAPVLDASYVGGEYQLLLEAPDPGADGSYDLQVSLCGGPNEGLRATSRMSVYYGDLRFHHVVCLDISGSMEYPTSAKLDAAKQAAKFYIDAVNDADKLTVVTFSGNNTECNEDATNLSGAGQLLAASGLSRGLLKLAVDGLDSVNMTSIGDGLWTSQDALDTEAGKVSYLHFDNILLLSDGLENEARYWSRTNCIGTGTVSDRIIGADTLVNAIAFGADADLSLMQQIGSTTEGDYSYVAVDPGITAAGFGPSSPAATTAMQNKLTLSFLGGLEKAKQLQRLAFASVNVPDGGTETMKLNLPDQNVRQAVLFVGWSEAGPLDVVVTDPDGQNCANYATARYQDKTHYILHFKSLKRGTYGVELLNKTGEIQECFAGISGIPDNNLRVLFTLSPHRRGGINGRPEGVFEQFEQGLPVDMVARVLDNKGPVRDAEVELQVVLPTGETACKSLRLFDDGQHVDNAYQDGIYGLRYSRTPYAGYKATDNNERPKLPANPKETGNYHVILTVTGKANDGAEFHRVIERDFKVFRRQELYDSDRDGLPDTWEAYYGTDPLKPDEKADPDHDDLTNTEEFLFGTHPFDPDTDGGGESDGSEVKIGHCPLNPLDDEIPPLSEVSIPSPTLGDDDPTQVVPLSIMLQFPDHASYRELHIYRSKDPNTIVDPANLVRVIDLSGKIVTYYLDEGLSDGVRYYYQLQAIGRNGAKTPYSRVLTAIAKADPLRPTGRILLNHGAATTAGARIHVKIIPGPGATEYRLSQKPFTRLDSYKPMVSETPFILSGMRNGQTAVVYVQFRSPSGNESPVTDDTIIYRVTGDNDRDGTSDPLDPDDDNDGLSDEAEIFTHGTDAFRADTDGDGYNDAVELKEGSDPLDRTSTPKPPGDDWDHDGYSNELERLYKSDPNNPKSVPDLRLRLTRTQAGWQVSLPTVTGVVYQFQKALDLSGPPILWKNTGEPFKGNGQDQGMPLTPTEKEAFLRVMLQVQ